MFGYLPGGYARFFDRLREVLEERGVKIRTRAPVARIVRSPSGSGVRVGLASSQEEDFDRAVVTTAAPLAAAICRGLTDGEMERLRGVRYLGIVCASLLLDSPLGGFYVTNITDGGFPFTGVVEMTTLVDRSEFGGLHLAYLPRYVTEEDPFQTLSDAEIQEQFLLGLGRMYPSFRRSQVRAFRISRVKQVCAIPTLGYSGRIPPIATSVPGIRLLGSGHVVNGTLNVNESVRLVDDFLEEVTR
jgi:protoporphyrinogen oxidase